MAFLWHARHTPYVCSMPVLDDCSIGLTAEQQRVLDEAEDERGVEETEQVRRYIDREMEDFTKRVLAMRRPSNEVAAALTDYRRRLEQDQGLRPYEVPDLEKLPFDGLDEEGRRKLTDGFLRWYVRQNSVDGSEDVHERSLLGGVVSGLRFELAELAGPSDEDDNPYD